MAWGDTQDENLVDEAILHAHRAIRHEQGAGNEGRDAECGTLGILLASTSSHARHNQRKLLGAGRHVTKRDTPTVSLRVRVVKV